MIKDNSNKIEFISEWDKDSVLSVEIESDECGKYLTFKTESHIIVLEKRDIIELRKLVNRAAKEVKYIWE